ncbi:UDP-glucose 4-epimerase GalE [Candidatus Woesearchaeota archaeon]|jgi:UDP-glucose 4-epimerase|nr:UDP-glucose 4-epimerase GalE [Candidatus Ruthturnera sp.]MBT4207343.1 UDP-glucose 4-epimerase GalE [Candidatus Woesearchaeota archaeon]
MKKIIFIVGGAGYIGSHMVKHAALSGYEVVTLDNLSTGHKDAVKYGKFELCDIKNKKKLDALFKKYQPDVVMHFSAYSIVSESVIDPYKYYDNNVSGTLNLLKIMLDNHCNKIIFSSTAAVFGNPEYVPIDERHIKKPINPYGKSKLMVEQILEDFSQAYDLKYLIFRYFNAAGHDEDGELSERHDPETHLLPLIMQAAREERGGIAIFGVDYDTKDGTCVRDYIHVDDLCSAHLSGLNIFFNTGGEVSSNDFNLGNGNGFSVKEVISKVKELTNKDFTVVEKERRSGDPAVLIASNIKASKILDFVPTKSKIEDIIKSLI